MAASVIEECANRLQAAADQVGHPDYSLAEFRQHVYHVVTQLRALLCHMVRNHQSERDIASNAAPPPPVTPHRSMPGLSESSDSANGGSRRQPCETGSGDTAAVAASDTTDKRSDTPVAWRYRLPGTNNGVAWRFTDEELTSPHWEKEPLYLHPSASDTRPMYPGLWDDAKLGQECEGLIALKTHFTGEPPYVGNDGVVLALREALDELNEVRDALTALVADVENQWGDPHTLRHAKSALADSAGDK